MRTYWSLALVSALVLSAGCGSGGQGGEQAAATGGEQAAPAPQGQGIAGTGGTVLETMNSGGYTYVHIDTGKEKLWAAANEFAVKVGDTVVLADGMPMQNFHSSTLDRDFDVVYFCQSIQVGGAGGSAPSGQMPEGHPPVMQGGHPPMEEPADLDLAGIEKAPGGMTVAEIFAQKSELGGKPIAVRGKVVKVNTGIMGTNWIHVRDGSGGDGSNDLTCTTDAEVAVGDVVLVKGTVTLDKDFGAGYAYDIIVEKAEVVKQ